MVQRRTMYPNGVAVTLDLECRPIHVKSGDLKKDSRTMALMIGNPLSAQVVWLCKNLKEKHHIREANFNMSHVIDFFPDYIPTHRIMEIRK